jgi:cytidylate kinase
MGLIFSTSTLLLGTAWSNLSLQDFCRQIIYAFINCKEAPVKVITIDGPSAAGKGTIGAKLSKELKCRYLDSGLLYRQFAAWILQARLESLEESAVEGEIKKRLVDFSISDANAEVLRTPEVSDIASKIGVFPTVRAIANQFQHTFAAAADSWVIIDGRDAGTVVFPQAQLKLFVTARPDVRANRRYAQLKERGNAPDLKTLTQEIISRDLRDQKRAVAPLKPASDAYIIDTSEESPDESVRRILKTLEKYLAM